MTHNKQLSLEEYSSELVTLSDQTSEIYDHVGDGQQAVNQLSDIQSALKSTTDNLEGVALEMFNQYTNSIYTKLGVSTTGIALENGNKENKKIALEDVGQKVRDILKAIWAFIVKAFNKAKEFLSRLLGFNKKIEEKAKEVNSVAKEYKSEGFTADFVEFVISSAEANKSTEDAIDKFTESNRTQEAIKKVDIAKVLEKMREVTEKANDDRRQERMKKIDELLANSKKSKSMVVGTHISNLLFSSGKAIKPSELITELENLYKLTLEIIQYNNKVYDFWFKYTDLISKENGSTFFNSFMSKQQASFYSDLEAPSSLSKERVDSDTADYKTESSSRSTSLPLGMIVTVSTPVFKPVKDNNVIENDPHQWTNNLTLASACGVRLELGETIKNDNAIPVLTLEEIEKITGIVSKLSETINRTNNYLVTKLEKFEGIAEQIPVKFDAWNKDETYKRNPNSNRLFQYVSGRSSDIAEVISKQIVGYFSKTSMICKDSLEYCEKSKDAYSQSSEKLEKMLNEAKS